MAREGGSYIRENGKTKLVERTQPKPPKDNPVAGQKPLPTEQQPQRKQE